MGFTSASRWTFSICEVVYIRLTPFQLLVKSHADKMLYFRDAGPLASKKLDVPAATEILDFSEGCHTGPTTDSFRIDPTSGPNSSWNLQACQVFAQDFRAAQYQGTERRAIMDASYEFHQLLPTFISHHVTASGFTDTQSYERFHELLSKRIRRHRVGHLFGHKYVNRCCRLNVFKLGESRLKIVNEVQDLREFLPAIRILVEEDGMSSDERDGRDDRCLQSTRPFWRHPAVTDWLRDIDSIGFVTAHGPARYGARRQSSLKVDAESQVVRGLPVNFYDWSYLDSLDESQYSDLCPKPAIGLGLSDSLQR